MERTRQLSMSDWKPYVGNRKIRQLTHGTYVISPADISAVTPISCSVCDHLHRSYEDEVSHGEFGCCYRCAQKWAYPRRKEWNSGWRPTKEQIELAERDRQLINVIFGTA